MIITTTDIQLFQILKQKIGEKEAEALVDFVDAKLKENNEQNLKVVATKEDIANLRSELKGDISKLETKIAETKFQLVLWAFVFWATQLGAIFTFIKFIK